MKTGLLITILALQAILQTVHAGTITVSTFDSDVEGWWWDTNPGTHYWQATEGNPGGHIHFVNNNYQYGTGYIHAPNSFLGDWSLLDCVGKIVYDVKIFDTGNIYRINTHAMHIAGPGGSATWYGPPPNPSTGWRTLEVPINESIWTITDGSWQDLLNDVTEFRICTAFYNNYWPQEVTGIDNVKLIPEPATIFILGIGALATIRRRNKNFY